MPECYSMISGHYYCGILYFITGIYLCCDDDTITQLTGLPDNVYSDSSYHKASKNWWKVVIIVSDNIVSVVYIKTKILI